MENVTGGQAPCHIKEGRKTMGEAWMDAMEARGEARGEIKGMIRAFNIVGYSVEDIAERVGKSVEYVKQVINGGVVPKDSK